MTFDRRSTLRLMLAGGLLAPSLAASAANNNKEKKAMAKVMPGAEPFHFEGNNTGVLVVHGFTGTTQSMRYLGEQLHKKYGFTVTGPRLAGHGTSPDDMEKTTYLNWVASAEAALQELAKKKKTIYVTGLSMGGTITLNLAARFPKIVKGIVPINAVAGIIGGGLPGLMMAQQAPPRIPAIGGDIKAKGVTELAYKEIPVTSLRNVYLLQAITSDLLPSIKCPTLVIQSREDHVVAPQNAKHIVDRMKADRVRLKWLNNSYHVATLDNDKDNIVSSAGSFFAELNGGGK